MNDSTRYREEHSLLYWLWLDWKEKRKTKNGKGMIIIIGKDTRAKLLDCAAYIDKFRMQAERYNESPSVIQKCEDLSEWLFRVAAGRMLRRGRGK